MLFRSPPPKVILNAPTKLMKGLGYGEGYAYAHDDPEGAKLQQHLPDELVGRSWWPPRTPPRG